MKADDLIFNNQCEKNVYNEYQLLGEMTNLILSIFINTTINLADQLHNLAILSHLLLFIYGRNKTNFLSNTLYLDIQMIVQDAFVCAAKNQRKKSDDIFIN